MRQRSNFWGVGNSFTVFNALQSTWMVKKKKNFCSQKKKSKGKQEQQKTKQKKTSTLLWKRTLHNGSKEFIKKGLLTT